MSKNCCRCCGWCEMSHEVCVECTLEELSVRATSKGFAFDDKPCGCFVVPKKNEISYCDYHYDLIMRESENKGGGMSPFDQGGQQCF